MEVLELIFNTIALFVTAYGIQEKYVILLGIYLDES